jgi:hypothetical protein
MSKNKIDYDLNIYIPEELDEDNNSFWDPTQWYIHVYIVEGNTHREAGTPFKLDADDIYKLGLNRDPYFKDDVDTWYGMEGFLFDYWSKMTDRVKQYLESFPKFQEDTLF